MTRMSIAEQAPTLTPDAPDSSNWGLLLAIAALVLALMPDTGEFASGGTSDACNSDFRHHCVDDGRSITRYPKLSSLHCGCCSELASASVPHCCKPKVPFGCDIVVAEFGLKQATAILGVMTLFLIVIHLGFASATALASAMIPIVIAVLQGVATSVVGMTMLLQFVVSFGFILVVNAPQNMVAYGTETFEARDFVRTGLVPTVIAPWCS